MTLRISGLWRYPVKTMAGEPVQEAELTANGIPGDRVVLEITPYDPTRARIVYRK